MFKLVKAEPHKVQQIIDSHFDLNDEYIGEIENLAFVQSCMHLSKQIEFDAAIYLDRFYDNNQFEIIPIGKNKGACLSGAGFLVYLSQVQYQYLLLLKDIDLRFNLDDKD